MPNVFIKSPAAELDYTVDWSDWLPDGDTISSVVWVVPAGLTQESASNSTTGATVWLSGGTLGAVYTVTCKITTVGGRIDTRSFRVRVAQR